MFVPYLHSFMGPYMGPQRAHMGPKPKIVNCCPTIKCNTIFPLKISLEIQWTYAYINIGFPWPHMGPQRAHMGPKPKIISFGPRIKCHTICPLKILPEIQWAYSHNYTRAPQGAQKSKIFSFGPGGPKT